MPEIKMIDVANVPDDEVSRVEYDFHVARETGVSSLEAVKENEWPWSVVVYDPTDRSEIRFIYSGLQTHRDGTWQHMFYLRADHFGKLEYLKVINDR